ncbi:MAG TPA: glycosyltransferase family 39 protein [Vicinamibacterales bacterium]
MRGGLHWREASDDEARIVNRLLPCLLLIAAAVAYTWRLGDTPTYVSPDEAIIAVDAQSLATTGRDVQGALMPLYFFIQVPKSERTGWFTPVIFYLSAAVQLLLPFSEWSIRIPSVIVGMANLVLLFFLVRELSGNQWIALMSAALLAMSPAHYIFSRYALDYLYPVPFLLAWLLALRRAMKRQTTSSMMLCGLCLGLGFYSYAAAVILTPLMLLLAIAVMWPLVERPKDLWPLLAGFAIPVSFFLIWLAAHPDAFASTAQRYAIYDSKQLSALQGLREFLSYPNIERMTSIYWSFLSPSVLFLSGDQLITFSTRQTGVFPTIMAILMMLGMVQVIERERSRFAWLVVAGFLIAPLPAVIVPENGAVNRATSLLPFGVLLASYGITWLWSFDVIRSARTMALVAGGAALAVGLAYGIFTISTAGRLGGAAVPVTALGTILLLAAAGAAKVRHGAIIATALVLIALLQFSSFARDYHGDYRVRVNSWLGGNLRGALETIIERCNNDACAKVYFAHLQSTGGVADIRNYWLDAYWRFYLIKHDRETLLSRSVHSDPGPIAGIPPGSLVLGNHGDPVMGSMVSGGELAPVSSIAEMDREPYFWVLEKRGS